MTLAITAAGAFDMADTERTEEPMEVCALEMGPLLWQRRSWPRSWTALKPYARWRPSEVTLMTDLWTLAAVDKNMAGLRQGGATTTGMDGRCYCCSSSYAGAAGKHEQLCLALQVAQVRCQALVDSSACRSLLRYDTWKDICEQAGKYPLLHRIPNGLIPLSKNKIPTLGIGRVCRFGQVVAFFVINNMQHMLSGDDALRTLKAKISYDHNENSLMGKCHVSKPSGDNDMDVHQCGWTWTSGLKNSMIFFLQRQAYKDWVTGNWCWNRRSFPSCYNGILYAT